MKQCTKCKEIKDLVYFAKDSNKKSGMRSHCKNCGNLNSKKWRENNKGYAQKWYQKNKNHHNKICADWHNNNREYHNLINKEWQKNNKEAKNKYLIEYRKEKRKNDILFVLVGRLRSRLRLALKAKYWQKNTKFSEYIGCSLEELKKHLESKFCLGMTWENKGEWHIDHIIPLSSAKNEEELYKLCHYKNLQPLWAADNLRKSDKIAN